MQMWVSENFREFPTRARARECAAVYLIGFTIFRQITMFYFILWTFSFNICQKKIHNLYTTIDLDFISNFLL